MFTLVLILIFFTQSPFPPAPQYQQLIWDYKKADSKIIRKAFDLLNWERLFDQEDINAQVTAFSETILNVFRNHVPNMYITVDDQDPVWMNETIKTKIQIKYELYKKDIQNGRFESDFVFLEHLINELNEIISSKKDLYYENLAKKLNTPVLQKKPIVLL